MTNRIRISGTAQQDIVAAKEWYVEQAGRDLEIRFQRELEGTFQQIETFPESFPVVYKDIRRANLHRFPYGVFYHRRVDHLYVLAVTHHARRPRVWKRRR